jgi:FMN phosphatase YigB (HAD superfamily)
MKRCVVLFGSLYTLARIHLLLTIFSLVLLRDQQDLATSSAKDQLKQLKKAANRGEITSREYYTHLLNHFGVREEHHGEALEQIKLSEEGIKLFDGIIPALAELRQQSIKLGIITDSMSSTDQKIGWIQNQGLDTTWFDVLVNSCEVGITKPHRKMYEYAMVASKVTPEHTAFIGHKKAELGSPIIVHKMWIDRF